MSTLPLPLNLERIYSDHHHWLRAWLRKRLGHEGDAADLAHDVFVRLMLKPPPRSFEGEGQARSYLSTVAGRLCINHWRRREIEQAWLDTLAVHGEAYAPSPEQYAIVLETLQALGAAMAELTGKGPQVFVYALVCGMTDQEIAEQLAISTRMVRKYVVKATLACMRFQAEWLADAAQPPHSLMQTQSHAV